MEKIIEPENSEFEKWIERPRTDIRDVERRVSEIFQEISSKGDIALEFYTKKWDGAELQDYFVSPSEFQEAAEHVSQELKDAIELAHQNIYCFHVAQKVAEEKIQTQPGVVCWRKTVGIERVGLSIPGGTAPLFSTVLMLAIPAAIAKCKEIILCSPPDQNGKIHPAILYTAQRCGISSVLKAGGAQAIAAMCLGTQKVKKVNKLFGPGNQYVTVAKTMAMQFGVSIDMPAGPSELLVYADNECIPEFVAADLLSQAEHGNDSQVILLAENEALADAILYETQQLLVNTDRFHFASNALKNSKAIVISDRQKAISFINAYAPEHLILVCKNPYAIADGIINAGSVFIGNYTPESAGDYASGTNHTLPTHGFAKSYSGVSLDSFTKKITFQEITKEGLLQIGQAIEIMADAEQLMAHKNAVSIRLKQLIA